jgi:hypothetical protein
MAEASSMEGTYRFTLSADAFDFAVTGITEWSEVL